ncbi:MAG TPA: two-component regulator propeller domain-containing protein [Verrucomicrobiae bacterium]|jgi:signal transduction histidine kinase/ligand-binding sensor domain-containing protein
MFLRCFTLVLFLVSPSFALAAENDSGGQDYVVKVWGADNGLTEGTVTDVAQTPEGYLWVGTIFGSVLRFDGTRFVDYNSANTPEFPLKWGLPALMVDKQGTLWISMRDGGLTTWNQQGFHPVWTSTNQPVRLLWSSPETILFILRDGELLSVKKHGEQWDCEIETPPGILPQSQPCADAGGRVWYLKGAGEIGIWNGLENKSVALDTELKGQHVKVLTCDAQGRIWIGTDQTLAVWQTNHFVAMTPTNGEPILDVKRIVPSGGGNLWVEANGRMRRCSGQAWQAESEGWNHELSKFTLLNFLQGDAEGGLWGGAGNLGLINVRADGSFHRLTTRDGLPSDTVSFAYEDQEGDIWTGYELGGLVQIRPRIFQSIGQEAGLGGDLLNTVCVDTRGAMWVGTHSGVVGHCENGVCTNLNLPESAVLQDSCVAADPGGRVWISAQGTGLWMLQSDHLKQIATQEQLGGRSARLLVPGHDGRLWVGTLWSIICVSNQDLTFEYTTRTVGGHPTALAEGTDGNVWAGTLAGNLLRWNGRQFAQVNPPDRRELGRIWSLLPTQDGGLWVGTAQGGLLYWNNGIFRRFTIKDGLPSDSIVQLLMDAEGNLWLGTPAGIVRIAAVTLARFEHGATRELPVSVYGHSDGLLTLGGAIFSQPNCWRGPDGALFFAMANSVAVVDPNAVHINPTPPAVVLEKLSVNDKPVWPQNPGAIWTPYKAGGESPDAGPEVNVGPGSRDLEFDYTGLSLSSAASVRFKYRLEGLENSWNDAGNETKAVYRLVPPGRYIFHVMACNSDSVWGQDNALVAVMVNPFFYQTVWFRGGVGLLGLIVFCLVVALSMRHHMRRRMEQLEHQHELERERSRIAQDLHDELGAGLTEIGLLGGLLRNPQQISMRKQEALERIVERCHNMVTALDEIVWAVNPRNDSINSLGDYLCHYAQNFLAPTAIRCRLEMHGAESDQPLDSEQRHNIFLAFKEALNNVVRHSEATEVRIKILFEEKSLLRISIEDNGHGLPATVEDGSDGLINLRQRMAQIGGQCEIHNSPSGGVCVSLSLPLAASRWGGA